jgi:ABC-type oligopeptide transport system ATPase subunit
MAKKYGKKNVIKVDPLAYNIGLIGESGIGKTTLAKEVCEKLYGEDGYMILNIGKEDGIDAIPNASYEDIPDWETFVDFVDYIIENRNTEYKDLKVLVYDTYDELMRITEPEVVRLHNKENPDKKVKTIKAAFGGFQAGEDKAVEIVLDKIWELKRIGIAMFVLGHTKRKTLTDVATGLEYDMLTTNMSNKYFTAMKTKLHVLGIASVNRSIEQKKVKQKIGADKVVGKVLDESRIITFRDDNFNIDSKSRFTDIISYIPLDVDEFIKAIEDAIKVAHEKQNNKGDFEATKKEQEKAKEEAIEKAVDESQKTKVNVKENEELAEVIKGKFIEATSEQKTKIKEIMDEYGVKSLKDTEETPTQAFREIAAVLK